MDATMYQAMAQDVKNRYKAIAEMPQTAKKKNALMEVLSDGIALRNAITADTDLLESKGTTKAFDKALEMLPNKDIAENLGEELYTTESGTMKLSKRTYIDARAVYEARKTDFIKALPLILGADGKIDLSVFTDKKRVDLQGPEWDGLRVAIMANTKTKPWSWIYTDC